MSRPVRIGEVAVGDRVTELETPTGPFYPVLDAGPGWLVVDSALPGEGVLPVRLRYEQRSWLRVAL